MYKVVIVDDEPLTVRSLKSMIESIDQQFQVIETAYDGKSGLELIERTSPDLVFMDINMPIYDGLEVIERLKNEGVKTEIVILSGYQEFDYAKKAITLGVADYMVKPLNPMNLAKQLQELKNNISRNANKTTMQAFERLFFSNDSSSNKVPEKFGQHTEFCMAKICFNAFNFIRNNQFSGREDESKTNILENKIQEVFQNRLDHWLLNSKYDNEFLLVATGDMSLWKRRIEQLFNEVSEKLPTGQSVTFVVGTTAKAWNELREMYVSLEGVLYCNAVFGRSKLLTDMEVESSSSEAQINQPEYIEKLIQKGKIDSLQEQLHLLFQNCEKREATQAELIQVLRKLMSMVCSDNSYETDFIVNTILISSYSYLELEKKMIKNMAEYMNRRNVITDLGIQSIIAKVARYLDEHFEEKILIQDVANMFNLNYSYLCSQFKKVKHVSPNEYMIIKRMEKAKTLLANCEELSIGEIAELVGYSDQYYFSKTFKIYEKQTPSEYKKEKGQGKEYAKI